MARKKRLRGVARAWNSKPVGVAAAGIVAIAVVVLVVVILLGIFAPVKQAAPAPQQSEAAPVPGASASADTGECNVPVGDTSYRPKMPQDLRWAAAQGLTWPVSASVGPTKSKNGFPACFARSPLGAALMGTTVLSEGWQGKPARSVAEFYVADSSGKQALLKKGSGSGSPAQIASAGISPAGFIVDSFTPDEAQVTIVATAPGTQSGYIGFPFSFVWVNGDWRVKALDTGDFWAGSTSSPIKGQFVEWRK